MLRGGVDLSDYSDLEQVDFIEAERRELTMKFVEQTNHIFATATDKDQAKKLVERLQDEYFIGTKESRENKTQRLSEEILDMQKKTYHMTASGGSGVLEITDGN
jgi:uncharacterized HAD superfamily protein